jgi:hypothetical protein
MRRRFSTKDIAKVLNDAKDVDMEHMREQKVEKEHTTHTKKDDEGSEPRSRRMSLRVSLAGFGTTEVEADVGMKTKVGDLISFLHDDFGLDEYGYDVKQIHLKSGGKLLERRRNVRTISFGSGDGVPNVQLWIEDPYEDLQHFVQCIHHIITVCIARILKSRLYSHRLVFTIQPFLPLSCSIAFG